MYFPIYKPTITTLEEKYVLDAVSSGWVSSIGPYVDKFEENFAKFCEAKYCVSVSNGTNALFLVLHALGIGPGDEVIVPDFSFIATANAVRHAGAIPVFVDIDLDTLCMSPKAFEAAITKNTRAVIPVHIYGHPAPMPQICDIASKNGILILEDCAEAHGAKVGKRSVGSWGSAGIFSFYGNKILTTGEGGAIVLDDFKLAQRLKFLRDHAMSPSRRYWHEEVGYNFRMTNLQAALGVAQLERADEIIKKKRDIFKWYERELADLKGVSLNRRAEWAEPVYWLVCLEIVECNFELRQRVMEKLRDFGVETRPYFYPMSTMPMYQSAPTPISQSLYVKGINLPSYFDLTESDVVSICSSVRKVITCLKS